MGYRILAVHAHPDDESSKGAATAARYSAQGHRWKVLTCTGGERGDIGNPTLPNPEELLANLPQVRRAEMAAAAKILGIEHEWLGYMDSGLPQGDPLPALPADCFASLPLEEPVQAVVQHIRAFQPHILVTYDEQGGYPHPDHIATHDVSLAAVRAAADPRLYPEAGPPWQVLKVYYDRAFTRQRFLAMHERLEKEGASPLTELLPFIEQRPITRITTQVHVAESFPARDEALHAHASQIDPNGWFFLVDSATQARIYPYDDWDLVLDASPHAAERAAARKDTGEIEPELYSGLPEVPQADELARSLAQAFPSAQSPWPVDQVTPRT